MTTSIVNQPFTCKNVAKAAAFGGTFGFGLGCLVGRLVEIPMFTMGAIDGVEFAARTVIKMYLNDQAAKHQWKQSSVTLLYGLSQAVISVAFCVTTVALSVFTPQLALSVLVINFFIVAWDIGCGLYQLYEENQAIPQNSPG